MYKAHVGKKNITRHILSILGKWSFQHLKLLSPFRLGEKILQVEVLKEARFFHNSPRFQPTQLDKYKTKIGAKKSMCVPTCKGFHVPFIHFLPTITFMMSVFFLHHPSLNVICGTYLDMNYTCTYMQMG
jgi:hypothetical protein